MARQIHSWKLLAALFAIPLAAAAAYGVGPVRVVEKENAIQLSNDFLSRTIEIQDGTVHTTQFLDKLSGQDYRLWGDEFQLKLIYERVGYEFGSENPVVMTSRNFRVEGRSVAGLPGGGKQVVFHLVPRPGKQPRIDIRLDLAYELEPEDFYTRQWMHVTTTGQGTYFIDSLAVLQDHVSVRSFSLGGFGQPLFADDLFMGLEYPTSLNVAQNSEVKLRRFVGLDIPPAGYTTQPVVIGVARQADEVHAAFMNYIRRMRVAPVRTYLLYNTWFDLRRPNLTEAAAIERVHELGRELLEKYKLHLDSFVLDDGWDNLDDLWHVNPKEFPHGFGGLVGALNGIGSHLGLWFGPIGGYSFRARRVASGRRMGMEVSSNGQFLVIAGTKYNRYLSDRMLHFEKEDGVNYYKIDGTVMGSNAPSQGYPLGVYSREADVRSLIAIMKALRDRDPHVFINITTSIWMSPWWLRWADTVWMGGEDSGYLSSVPAISPRQSAISYRDSVLYDDYVRHSVQFPMSSIMTHGIIRGQHNLLGGKNEPIQDWDDELVHYFSVGNMMIELYITPSLLDRAELQSLGRGLEWQRAESGTLLGRSTMVLGDPAKRQPYGFVHYSPDETIVTLRNPFVTPHLVSLKLDRESGFEPWASADVAEIIYPYRLKLPQTFKYGDTLSVELGAYQEKTFLLRPAVSDGANVCGVRFSYNSQAPNEAQYLIYGPDGATRLIRLDNPQNISQVLLDGHEVGTKSLQGKSVFPVHFGKQESETQPSFTAPNSAEVDESGSSETWQVSFALDVPEDFANARFALLLEPVANLPGVTAQVRERGASLPVHEENGGHSEWYWFIAGLPAGEHHLSVDLHIPRPVPGPIRLSGWLLANRMLATRALTITFSHSSAPISQDRLPYDSKQEAETYSLFNGHIQ